MDTIRYLLGFILKLAFGLFLVAIIIWLVGFLYPQFKFSSLVSGDVFTRDWLPAPKNYGPLLGGAAANGSNGSVYVHGAPYDGYKNAAKSASNEPVWSGSAGGYVDRLLYVRNLSVYEYGNISYGMTFIGEARDTMFKNGIFPIHVIDASGRVIGTAQAINTGNWAIPGWARFQATVPVRLPSNVPCALIFQSGNQPLQTALPVRCN